MPPHRKRPRCPPFVRHNVVPSWASSSSPFANTCTQGVDHPGHQLLAIVLMRVGVGLNKVLVHQPRHLQADVIVIGIPQRIQPLLLTLGEDNPSWSTTLYGSYITDHFSLLSAGVSSRCRRCRQVVSFSAARWTTWKGSITLLTVGRTSSTALAYPVNPSIVTTCTRARKVSSRARHHRRSTSALGLRTMSTSRAGPVPSTTGARSTSTVTKLDGAPGRAVCVHTCSSTPSTRTPSH